MSCSNAESDSSMSVEQAYVTLNQPHTDVCLPYHLMYLVYFSQTELDINQYALILIVKINTVCQDSR